MNSKYLLVAACRLPAIEKYISIPNHKFCLPQKSQFVNVVQSIHFPANTAYFNPAFRNSREQNGLESPVRKINGSSSTSHNPLGRLNFTLIYVQLINKDYDDPLIL